ncbi:hypothetical protein M9458_003214, partial [Cirrhinus mrigala]
AEDTMSDQPALVDYAREYEGLEKSLAHCTTTEGDMPILLSPSSDLSVCPELLASPVIPLTGVCGQRTTSLKARGLKKPTHPISLAATTSPTICLVGSLQVCQSPSASWLEDPFPRLCLDPATPPWLLALASSSVCPLASLDCLVLPLCLGQSLTIRRLWTPLLQLSSFPSAPPWSFVAPTGFPPPPWLPEPSIPPWPSGSWLIFSPSLPRAPPQPAPP